MELKNSILTVFSKKEDIVFSAFNYKVLFGVTKNSTFVPTQTFEFASFEYHLLFIGLFNIIKTLSRNSEETSGVFCKKTDVSYFWQSTFESNNVNVSLFIKSNDNQNTLYSITLNELEFNDLPRILGHLLLPSLNLTDKFFSVFHKLSQLDISELLKLRQISVIESSVSSMIESDQLEFTQMEKFSCCFLIEYHLDVIVATNKILSFYNNEQSSTLKNIAMMEISL